MNKIIAFFSTLIVALLILLGIIWFLPERQTKLLARTESFTDGDITYSITDTDFPKHNDGYVLIEMEADNKSSADETLNLSEWTYDYDGKQYLPYYINNTDTLDSVEPFMGLLPESVVQPVNENSSITVPANSTSKFIFVFPYNDAETWHLNFTDYLKGKKPQYQFVINNYH